MKKYTIIAIWLICAFAHDIHAATFKISNYSNADIVVKPVWNRHNNNWVTLKRSQYTKNYNSWFEKVLIIEWCNNGQRYKVDLSGIDNAAMVNREFAILNGGDYQHTLVKFPLKYTSGTAEVDLARRPCQ